MPRFLDHHPTVANMPPEAVEQIKAKIASKQPDQFGVVGLNMFVGKDQTWCYAEAPSAEALHKTHEAMGVRLGPGDVIEVQSLI